MPLRLEAPFLCPPPLLYVSDMLSVAMHATLHLQSLFNIAKEKGNTWVFQLYFCHARILWGEKWPTAMLSWVGGMLEIWQASIVKSFKFLCKYRIYSINRPGRLLNFWTLRVGAYSRWALIRGWALIKFSVFSASVVCLFCNKTINGNDKTRRSNKARFL